jgi:hypothetical protein
MDSSGCTAAVKIHQQKVLKLGLMRCIGPCQALLLQMLLLLLLSPCSCSEALAYSVCTAATAAAIAVVQALRMGS